MNRVVVSFLAEMASPDTGAPPWVWTVSGIMANSAVQTPGTA